MSAASRYPIIAVGPLVEWERDRRAKLALIEEGDEISREQRETVQLRAEIERLAASRQPLRAEINPAFVAPTLAPPATTPIPDPVASRTETGASSAPAPQELTQIIEFLTSERQSLAQAVHFQMTLVEQIRLENEAHRRFAHAARVILTDLIGSRGYRLMRAIGRWDSLERKIMKAFRI